MSKSMPPVASKIHRLTDSRWLLVSRKMYGLRLLTDLHLCSVRSAKVTSPCLRTGF